MKYITKTTFGFVGGCVLVIIAVVSSHLSTTQFINDFEWTVHTVEVRDRIENLTTQLTRAQSDIRAYHLAQEPYYLERHRDETKAVTQEFDELRRLTTDNAVQQRNLETAGALMQEKFGLWEKSLELRKKGSYGSILERLRNEDVKKRDQELYRSIETMKHEEDSLLAQRIAQAKIQGRNVKWVVWTGGLLACLSIIIASLLMSRDSRRRKEVEQHIDLFFSISLDLLCISGMDGFFKRLSPSYQDVLGYSLAELYARPIVEFIHPDDVDRTNREIEVQLKGSKVLNFENRFRCRDGGYRTFAWNSVPVGQYMYAVARDVTDQKKFEAQLMSAREDAQRAAQAKSLFLANMSHEIRTPLNGVVGMTDLLARTAISSEQSRFVAAIRGSADILLKIVNEILDFSKIEAGRMNIEATPFDIRQMIDGRISLIGILAAEKGLTIKSQIEGDVPAILVGDAGKLGQVLLNLLNNAVKFTEVGEVSLFVGVEHQSAESCRLKVRVTDQGIGIGEADAKRIFEPFEQADSSTARKFGGTGLGLTLCRRIVELMGGTIGVQSEIGAGATFWFKVELGISELMPAQPTLVRVTPSRPGLDELARRKELRVLIAEDNTMNQVIIMNMMQALGYKAELVKNGHDAVERSAVVDFDIILMDQHMPGMDGVAASHAIRAREQAHPNKRKAVILAFTANVLQEGQGDNFAFYVDDYLLKPVTLEALETTMEKWSRPRATAPLA